MLFQRFSGVSKHLYQICYWNVKVIGRTACLKGFERMFGCACGTLGENFGCVSTQLVIVCLIT